MVVSGPVLWRAFRVLHAFLAGRHLTFWGVLVDPVRSEPLILFSAKKKKFRIFFGRENFYRPGQSGFFCKKPEQPENSRRN
jgi:hypothetical protein